MSVELEVEALGAAGDGVTAIDGRRVFVPGALPGERWRIRLDPKGDRAVPLSCLRSVPRAEPPCRHFGRCGGCRLQHLLPADYAAAKRGRVLEALRRQGLFIDMVGDLRVGPPASRRRLRLALTKERSRLRLGLRERSGQAVVPLDMCPAAEPALEALLPTLAVALARGLVRPWPAEASLTLTEGGTDLLLHAARPPTAAERAGVASLADGLDLARIAWQVVGPPESLLLRRAPSVTLSGIAVEPPPGAFLQASAFGEHELAGAVSEWAGDARHAADLYAGLGTLTFALAGRVRRVLACESEPMTAAALRRAAAGRAVTVVERDLVRRPLQPSELTHDLVVLDPPRAGAPAQCAALARSRVPRVIYASCHPESFARDARILVDSGFALAEVRPIDQFLWSAEIELAALLVRPGSRANRP